ncbi:MAG TPA: DUF1345 domain-containing protein [Burkholderiaceae bacterium]
MPKQRLGKHLAENTSAQRLLYGLAAGLATMAAPWPLGWAAKALLGWCAGAAVFLALAWWLAVEFDAHRTRQRAQAQDYRSIIVFFIMLVAITFSVVAIAAMLQQLPDLPRGQRGIHIALSVLALAASWLLIQTIFGFRYAHLYYSAEGDGTPAGAGLVFPGGQMPDYFDFLYHAYVVGMTSQVSDVQVTSREMRRLTMVHGLLAFTFNMLVLALSVNVVAGAM